MDLKVFETKEYSFGNDVKEEFLTSTYDKNLDGFIEFLSNEYNSLEDFRVNQEDRIGCLNFNEWLND